MITKNKEESDEVVKKDWGNSFLSFLQKKEDKIDDVQPDPIELMSKLNDEITNPESTPQQVDEIGCDKCGKKFKKKENLDRHISVIHQDEKNFSCQSCGTEIYGNQLTFMRHQRSCTGTSVIEKVPENVPQPIVASPRVKRIVKKSQKIIDAMESERI